MLTSLIHCESKKHGIRLSFTTLATVGRF